LGRGRKFWRKQVPKDVFFGWKLRAVGLNVFLCDKQDSNANLLIIAAARKKNAKNEKRL